MANPLHIERMRSINFRLSHDCARIEAECGGDAWDREQIIDYLRQPNAFGKAAMNETGDVVLGYMLYRFSRDCTIFIDRILVRPERRRQGVGSAMLQRLKERVGVDGILRVSIVLDIAPHKIGVRVHHEGLGTCLTKNRFRLFQNDSFASFVYEG